MGIGVWMIIDSLPQRGGGMELQAVRLGRALRRLGVDVYYISRQGDFSHIFEDERAYIRTLPPLKGGLPGPIEAVLYLFQVLELLFRNRKQVDVIHAHALANGLVAVIAGRLLNKPALVKVASAGSHGEIARHRVSWLPGFRLWVLNHLDRIVAITPEINDELIRSGYQADKIVQIPNGIALDEFTPGQDRIGHPGDDIPPVAICVARFVVKKRHALLVEAWKKVIETLPDARLILVGDGPLRVNIEQQANQAGILSSVEFVGDVPPEKVMTLLRQADLFVLPSVSEGLSNAMLEAQACEIPIVTSLTAGTSHIVKPGESGVLLSEEITPSELAVELVALLKDRSNLYCMGRNARQDMQSRFSFQRIAGQYLDLYREILSEEPHV